MGGCGAYQVGALGVAVHGHGRHRLEVEEARRLELSLWAKTCAQHMDLSSQMQRAAPRSKETYSGRSEGYGGWSAP